MTTHVRSRLWALRIAAASTIAGCIALAGMAQPVETPVPKTERVDKIEALVKSGQLMMTEAVKMAEARTKGVAFEARCAVRPGPFANNASIEPQPNESDPQKERLVYKIICVLDSRPTTVIIDGLEKKIVSPPAPPVPDPSPKPAPEPAPESKEPVQAPGS